jgi:hypothetical protein
MVSLPKAFLRVAHDLHSKIGLPQRSGMSGLFNTQDECIHGSITALATLTLRDTWR